MAIWRPGVTRREKTLFTLLMLLLSAIPLSLAVAIYLLGGWTWDMTVALLVIAFVTSLQGRVFDAMKLGIRRFGRGP